MALVYLGPVRVQLPVQEQAAAWYLRLADRLFGAPPAASKAARVQAIYYLFHSCSRLPGKR